MSIDAPRTVRQHYMGLHLALLFNYTFLVAPTGGCIVAQMVQYSIIITCSYKAIRTVFLQVIRIAIQEVVRIAIKPYTGSCWYL